MSKALIVYVLCLPLAVLIGFQLATPTDFGSFAIILLAFGALLIPFVLKSHHLLLIMTWNAALIVFFLPGSPPLGMLAAVASLSIAIVDRTMNKNKQFLRVRSVTLPLIMLTVVVAVTAQMTGGIGGRALGAETWGAKRYLGVFGAIIGYFALTTERVPREKAVLYASLFFLGGLTSMVSDLIYMAGTPFYFLFLLFPSDHATVQAMTVDALKRLSGLAFACAAGSYFLLARYGFQGIFDLTRPWRLLLVILFVIGSLLGGYRGLVILLTIVFIVQFFVEGVYRTKLGPVLVVGFILMAGFTVGFIDKMPLSVQRAFSFLPLAGIDSTARLDASGTLDWRLTMWKIVAPEVPKYLLLGKGYGFSGTDYYLTHEAVRRGMYAAYEDTLVTGNYHNGVLTLLVPFGIFGFGAFMWFCFAGLNLLVRNFRYGDPQLKMVNTFLLTYFTGRLLFYMIFYGQFDADFFHFTGTLGLSIALNGGICSPKTEPAEVPVRSLEPVPA
jgi:hypothetical protein